MPSYHPKLLAQPVPRYTSYPTAAEFTVDVGEIAQRRALAAIEPNQTISVYVHIPYCRDICWYCGCNTGRANRVQRLTAYLDALLCEVRTVAGLLNGRGRVSRIAFGGGSPNALAPSDFLIIADALSAAFATQHTVLSVELDPRGFDSDWASAVRTAGVSRASLGVQTFDSDIQAAIGRVQPAAQIVEAVRLLRESAVTSINFDLMYGLPRQNQANLVETLEASITLAPERIALFGYAHVPHLLPRQKRVRTEQLPGQDERFDMAALGHARLVQAGYVPIGFDHFALPDDAMAHAVRDGKLRRNFQGFTDDTAEVLIGLGASAISQFPGLLVQNEKNSGRYRMRAMAGQLTGERGVLRDEEDRRRGAIIEALLCGRVVALGAYLFDPAICGPLAAFLDNDLAILEGERLNISPVGRPYARTIASLFDRHRTHQPGKFSNAI